MRVHTALLVDLFFALPLSAKSGSVTPIPILQSAALPRYPPIAMAEHASGKVILRATIMNGQVVKTEVLSNLKH